LIRHEQGLGDTIQFCRYLPPLLERGTDAVLSVQPALLGLIAPLAPAGRVVTEPAEDEARPCIPLLSLPGALGTRLETIPAPTPYLFADPGRRAQMAERLGPKTRPRVGLAFSGDPNHRNDKNRSIAWARLAPLMAAADVEWHVLQKQLRPADSLALDAGGRARFHGGALADFADAAALTDLMDLVISVDTSLAHLAGALGKPVWILLPFNPDWRWLLGRDDSPWYPSARLFRQPAPGDWEAVIAQAAIALREAFG
jgi:hypothetical protein